MIGDRRVLREMVECCHSVKTPHVDLRDGWDVCSINSAAEQICVTRRNAATAGKALLNWKQIVSVGNRLRGSGGLDVDAACLRLIEQQVTNGIQHNIFAGSASALAEIGPYKISELLSRGGMGTDYRATHCRLKQDVATKR